MATAEQGRNVERVRAGLDAFGRGDQEGALEVFDEDIEIFTSADLLNAGTYRGHDGYRKWLEQWLDAWEGFEIVGLERVEPVGEHHVVASVRQGARGKGSGIPVEMTIGYMWELGEGKTIAMHLYATWEEAAAVAERRESERSG